MSDRRGVAMLAALWIVVAIAAVSLTFALDAKDRRTLGLNAADRGRAHAAAIGAIAETQATLDVALTSAAQNRQELAGTRSADPWMDIDSIYSGPVIFDSTRVDVRILDLGAKLNINTADSAQLRAFLGNMLGDYTKGDHLAQLIADWRDPDDNARFNSDESDGYEKKGLLAIPTNAPFREVSDLLMVEGMTPDLYAMIAGDLTTWGPGTINVNTAPVEILRSIPNLPDDVLANILTQRSRGLRINSLANVLTGGASGVATGGGGRGGGRGTANPLANVELAALQRYADVTTAQVLVTAMVQPSKSARLQRVRALLARGGQSTTVTWEQW